VDQLGYVEDGFIGRRRYFLRGYLPGTYEFMYGATKKNAPPNMRIQGTAAALMDTATISIDKQIPHRGWSDKSGIILQVHDQLIASVPDSRKEEAAEIFTKEMNFVYKGVPITSMVKWALRWSDL
jgi:DNA polymerase I-like protein with 3'-5' exonuclease and polymerase domains